MISYLGEEAGAEVLAAEAAFRLGVGYSVLRIHFFLVSVSKT